MSKVYELFFLHYRNEHDNTIFSKYLCGFRNDYDVHFCPLPVPLALLGLSEIFFLKTRSTFGKLYLQIYIHFFISLHRQNMFNL